MEFANNDASFTDTYTAKRTRQNIAKMEARKLRQQDKLHRQAAEAGIQTPMLVDQHKKSNKNSTKARRQRKEKERARKAADQANAMDIG